MRSFLNRKRLSYFILQEIPDLFSNLKCLNMQMYIRQWYIICMCKISVWNDIIKDILKKKTMSTEFLTADMKQNALIAL